MPKSNVRRIPVRSLINVVTSLPKSHSSSHILSHYNLFSYTYARYVYVRLCMCTSRVSLRKASQKSLAPSFAADIIIFGWWVLLRPRFHGDMREKRFPANNGGWVETGRRSQISLAVDVLVVVGFRHRPFATLYGFTLVRVSVCVTTRSVYESDSLPRLCVMWYLKFN